MFQPQQPMKVELCCVGASTRGRCVVVFSASLMWGVQVEQGWCSRKGVLGLLYLVAPPLIESCGGGDWSQHRQSHPLSRDARLLTVAETLQRNKHWTCAGALVLICVEKPHDPLCLTASLCFFFFYRLFAALSCFFSVSLFSRCQAKTL